MRVTREDLGITRGDWETAAEELSPKIYRTLLRRTAELACARNQQDWLVRMERREWETYGATEAKVAAAMVKHRKRIGK